MPAPNRRHPAPRTQSTRSLTKLPVSWQTLVALGPPAENRTVCGAGGQAGGSCFAGLFYVIVTLRRKTSYGVRIPTYPIFLLSLSKYSTLPTSVGFVSAMRNRRGSTADVRAPLLLWQIKGDTLGATGSASACLCLCAEMHWQSQWHPNPTTYQLQLGGPLVLPVRLWLNRGLSCGTLAGAAGERAGNRRRRDLDPSEQRAGGIQRRDFRARMGRESIAAIGHEERREGIPRCRRGECRNVPRRQGIGTPH